MGCRRGGSDPALRWLWSRPVAIAPIRPLAWELPCAAGAAREKAKRQIYIYYQIFSFFSFFFFFSCSHSIWTFLGKGLNLSHLSDPCHSNDNTRTLSVRPPGNSSRHIFRDFYSTLNIHYYFQTCSKTAFITLWYI